MMTGTTAPAAAPAAADGRWVVRFGFNRNEHTTAHRRRADGRWVAMGVTTARQMIAADLAVEHDPNTCRACDSADLWSNHFDRRGAGCSADARGARYRTLCQSCGTFQ